MTPFWWSNIDGQTLPEPVAIWPIWARLLKRRRAPGDRGVGDTAEHVHGLIGSDGFALWYWAVFRRPPCLKCPNQLNQLYPYETSQSVSTP